MSSPSPNPISVGLLVLKARRVSRPRPKGSATVDHSVLANVLATLKEGGVAALVAERQTIAGYRDLLEAEDPNSLNEAGALAFWINLYNAGALDLAAETVATGEPTVLRVAGGFSRRWASVGGEELSLTDIEHGKIRRFSDPRIHAGLVCGSASCPTLRFEPFVAEDLEQQLDDQMRHFLVSGGAVRDEARNRLLLSRIFLWYGADFTRPRRMPTVLPTRKAAIADALGRWLAPDIEAWRLTSGPRIEFRPYDWSLACSIG